MVEPVRLRKVMSSEVRLLSCLLNSSEVRLPYFR